MDPLMDPFITPDVYPWWLPAVSPPEWRWTWLARLVGDRQEADMALTLFLDAQGKSVDIMADGTSKTFSTVSKSKPGDGAKNAPDVADDSPNDQQSD
jgi:hypothetical protein